MATPSEKLADSLEVLHALQKDGMHVVKSKDLSRTHRERLVATGFLREVMKGWYIPSRPDELAGGSTAWYASFWDFCSSYLSKRFKKNWCLSPEQSLLLYAGNWTVPKQLLVRSSMGSNKATILPFDTSIFDVRYAMPASDKIKEINGIRVYDVSTALIACNQRFFQESSCDVQAILNTFTDVSSLLAELLEGGHSVVAGRLAGAFRSIGQIQLADEIVQTMQVAGHEVRETNPFQPNSAVILQSPERLAHVARMQVLWQEMRKQVIKSFPSAPGINLNSEKYLKQVEEIYLTDAYNSLSIEGYRVSEELIERVRSGKWNPDNEEDKKDKNALAARGYWQAFQAVKESVLKVLTGNNPGQVAKDDHRVWYRELFAPSITAGILKPSDLAGYRNSQVYIRQSMHVPPTSEKVRDLMPTFFELLMNETEASVRVVLGHFFFVNIHPYMDGNGRLGRFLMNVMLASGGYPWIVVPVELRNDYFSALEFASVKQDIEQFCQFIKTLLQI